MRTTLKRIAPGIAVVAILGGYTALALASSPSGQSATLSSTGRLAETGLINADRIKLQTKDPTDVYHFQVSYAVGGFSGWHTHPGFILATVKSGKVIREVGCDEPVVYSAGDSFTESEEQPSGQVSNYYKTADATGAQPAVIDAVQIAPAGSARRVEQAGAPDC
jgi:quercetin dioxygenase-like cupin family protein